MRLASVAARCPAWFPCLPIAVSLVACAGTPASPSAPEPLPPGTTVVTLHHGGLARNYRAHLPATPAPPGGFPVVLAFHGGGGNARQFQETSRIAELADQEGFLAIFPDGTGLIGLHFWNAGNCCGRARLLNVDDVGFVAAVLDDLDGRASINTTRIYATGHSNGAMMSYRLAVELGNRLAAIAPVGGAMNLAEFRPVRAIPVLHIHSADDPRALYEGGEGPPFPGTNQTTVHRPVEEGLALWRGVNGCPATPVVVRELAGGATGPDAAHTATLRRWEPCMSGAPVELWRLTVAGHGWPGQVHGLLPDSLMGPSTAVLNAAEEIWNFVRRFP